MIYMGIDLGYREATTVVIVRPNSPNNRFTFVTIQEGVEFEEMIHKLYELAQKHNIPGDNVNSPRHPAVEHELRKRLPTLEQLMKRQQVEKV